MILKISKLMAFLAALLLAGNAAAKPDPAPRPSGTVIHLFSPHEGNDQILHEMFVTGTPGRKPGEAIPKGRRGRN